jgi:low affinity Fe/Cu permease
MAGHIESILPLLATRLGPDRPDRPDRPDAWKTPQPVRNTMTQVEAPAGRESIFDRTADYVSAAMGRPTNIMIWLVLVVGWTLLFAAHIVSANANFLPGWFTGTAFNFPLNLVTTVAELFIGFLVAAAANRSERNLELTLAAIADQEKHIEDVETKLSEELASNTVLTEQVHELASQIHDFLRQRAMTDHVTFPDAGEAPA